MELITKSFASQCIAFPSRVEQVLAKVETVQEAKDVLDKAVAMQTYADQLRAGVEIEKPIALGVLKIKAKIGELCPAKPPKESGAMKGKKGITSNDIPFDANTMTAYRKLAKHKDKLEEYAESIDDVPTQSGFISFTAEEKIKKTKQEIEQEIKAKVYKKTQPTIELMDAVEWLSQQEKCDLLITDPPYSTDVSDVYAFALSWLPSALSLLKPTGRAYVCIGAYPRELSAYCSIAMPTQILVWTYRNTLGPSPKQQYKLNWQAILYYENEKAPPLDCPVMTEQFSVQDINAPDGRLGDRYHAWQKPMELAERFIRHSTKEGDLVLDPFACTGTFLLAASQLGRIAKGCDISQEHIDIAVQRGCKQ